MIGEGSDATREDKSKSEDQGQGHGQGFVAFAKAELRKFWGLDVGKEDGLERRVKDDTEGKNG